jgi:hypothetical protein
MSDTIAWLAEITGKPENKACADCGKQFPQYASTNLGVFLCERCAGLHQALGPHVSVVRKITDPSWLEDEVRTMDAIGNLNAKCYWEYCVPFGDEMPEPMDPNILVQDWIRRKYERREFVRSPHNEEPLDPGVRQYETEGFLLKEGGGTGSGKWQSRYFILRDFKMEYYESQPDPGVKSVPKNIVPITPNTRISVRTTPPPPSLYAAHKALACAILPRWLSQEEERYPRCLWRRCPR